MSRKKKFERGLFYLFFVSLLFSACGGAEIDIDSPNETITEQPTSIPTETPVPTPTIKPTPTLNPELQELLSEAEASFDSETLGFHDLYELEFILLENGQAVAQSPFDKSDDPHFIYNAESSKWVDNHPGRREMEQIFPEVLDSGRSVWFELQGYIWDKEAKQYRTDKKNEPAVWDQEMMAYRYPKTADMDEGHEQYYQPLMALTDRARADIEEGRVTFAETIKTDDFVLGKSGVKIDYFISTDHPYVKWWENLPADLSSQMYGEMFLDNFPWLKGQQVTVRYVAQDITDKSNSNHELHREQTFAQGDFTRLINAISTGFIPEVAPNTNLVTMSETFKPFENDRKGDEVSFAVFNSSIWAFLLQQYGSMEGHGREYLGIDDSVRKQVMIESGLPGPETARIELKE